MSDQNGHAGDGGTLDAVRRLEQTLERRTTANEVTAERLAAARTEADGILAAARTTGTEAGHKRAAALAAQATADVKAIQAGGMAAAEELRERVLVDRDDLVAELTAIITAVEV